MATASHAQSESDLEQPSGNQLPTIMTQAETDEKPYAAKTASAVLRSDAALFETAQSISVITNQQIEQKQAKVKIIDFLNSEQKGYYGIYGAGGTGKTFLSAFDVREFKADKILFLAHREELLESMVAFKEQDYDRRCVSNEN